MKKQILDNEAYATILHNYSTKLIEDWPIYTNAVLELGRKSKVKEVTDFYKQYQDVINSNTGKYFLFIYYMFFSILTFYFCILVTLKKQIVALLLLPLYIPLGRTLSFGEKTHTLTKNEIGKTFIFLIEVKACTNIVFSK